MRAVVVGVVLAWAATVHAESRRFALVVGANAGASEPTPLRYAEHDAGKFARVLVELADVAADDLLLLQGQSLRDLERAIAELRDKIAGAQGSPDARVVLVFYYSGHSDGEGLELGSERLAFARLKALLAGTGADVRVAVVDACRSGAALLSKGGRPVEAFTIKLTDSLNATGEVFITSSAADEAALESAEVMGSFFTHNLVSGLRGAADSSGDRRVTLAEAYRYAFDRTVEATALMPVGAQHPSFDYRLSGQGELVLTSLVRTSASLVLPEAERVLVSDLSRDQVLVELGPGALREVALPPGKYGVRVMKGGVSYGGRVVLENGAKRAVRVEDLEAVSAGVTARKGALAGKDSDRSQSSLFASLGVGSAVSHEIGARGLLRLGYAQPTLAGFRLAALVGFGAGGAGSEGTVQLRGGLSSSTELGPVRLHAGLEAGPGYFWQSEAARTAQAVGLLAGPRGGISLGVSSALSLTLELEVMGLWARVDDQLSVRLAPAASLGVAVAR